MKIPPYLTAWFRSRNWQIRSYQRNMFKLFHLRQSALLIAPPGAGKTLASFLPSLIDIHKQPYNGLHTLYISPLKALTYDIQRNLLFPIKEMQLKVTVAARTGDTNSYQRQRQLKRPPQILLITPESLMLLLSYEIAKVFFKNLNTIIVDEVHSLVGNKRGDLTILALSRLSSIATNPIIFGLSGTVANAPAIAAWLAINHSPVEIVTVKSKKLPQVTILPVDEKIPYFGVMANYAIPEIYKTLIKKKITLIFVNTRAQAEFIFQQLWMINHLKLPIAIYHGSLDKDQRLNVQKLAIEGQLRAVISTSALELGIDWGDVDCVLQIGTPKGVSRLLQRIGRSNHQLNRPSYAQLVPANCFEVLECQAAINAIKAEKLDGIDDFSGSLDVVIQYIVNCACSEPIEPDVIYAEILATYPYHQLEKVVFDQLFAVASNGGYVLQHYERYHRLKKQDINSYQISSPQFARRHRLNIGTIIEAPTLQVKLVSNRRSTWLGQVEEKFVQQLVPGDTFMFAGKNVEYVAIKDMVLKVKLAKKRSSKMVSYAGGKMPLTTYLASVMLDVISYQSAWGALPLKVQNWLRLQTKFSLLPSKDYLLIEHFLYKRHFYTVIYTFEGRVANNTLGMLLTQRMEKAKFKPLSFTVTDYALAISSMVPLTPEHINNLFTVEAIEYEYKNWYQTSTAAKRTFRQIIVIAGLIERKFAGKHRPFKQVTFSTDLIFDVLQRYEPNHILLAITQQEVEKNLLNLTRLTGMLHHLQNNIIFKHLAKPSPMSLSLLMTFRTETIAGNAIDELLQQASLIKEAEKLIQEVNDSVD